MENVPRKVKKKFGRILENRIAQYSFEISVTKGDIVEILNQKATREQREEIWKTGSSLEDWILCCQLTALIGFVQSSNIEEMQELTVDVRKIIIKRLSRTLLNSLLEKSEDLKDTASEIHDLIGTNAELLAHFAEELISLLRAAQDSRTKAMALHIIDHYSKDHSDMCKIIEENIETFVSFVQNLHCEKDCPGPIVDHVTTVMEDWCTKFFNCNGTTEIRQFVHNYKTEKEALLVLKSSIDKAVLQDWSVSSENRNAILEKFVKLLSTPSLISKIADYFCTKLKEFRANGEESHRRNAFLLAKAIISLSDGFREKIEAHQEFLKLERELIATDKQDNVTVEKLDKAVNKEVKYLPFVKYPPPPDQPLLHDMAEIAETVEYLPFAPPPPPPPRPVECLQTAPSWPSRPTPNPPQEAMETSDEVEYLHFAPPPPPQKLAPPVPLPKPRGITPRKVKQRHQNIPSARLSNGCVHVLAAMLPTLIQISMDEIEEKKFLGEGGQATAYVVKVKDNPTKMVMKQFNDKYVVCIEDMLKELGKLLECGRHPHIVQVFGVVYHDSDKTLPVGILMEHMDYGSLYELIHVSKEEYGEKEVLEWCLQAVSAIRHLHAKKLIHRDVKPENLLLCTMGNQKLLKLADFGMVKRDKPTIQSAPKSGFGTNYYRAPEGEQWKDGSYSTPVDIFSLGITIWEMAQRRPPFDESNLVFIDEEKEIRRPSLVNPAFPWLADLVQRMWDEDPEKRPTITEVYADLERLYKALS